MDPKYYDDIEGQIHKFSGCETYLELFEHQVKTRKDHPFLGSRIKQEDGSFGGYEWQTYGEIEKVAQQIAKGTKTLKLSVETEGDGRKWRFVGIWAKNRWEWLATHIANMYYTVTTIGFFDSMGAAAVDFILDQTELTCVFAAQEYINKLVLMKKDGMAKNLKFLVSFDQVTTAQIEAA